MSILSLTIQIFFLWLWGKYHPSQRNKKLNNFFFALIFFLGNVNCISLLKVLDCKIGDESILNCPINRNNWSYPIIFQWYRSLNNYSIPIASQFDDYPIHINDIYQQRYSLLNNGSLKIDNVQFDDNDTYQCRLIFIDRGLLDIKEKYSITLRVNGKEWINAGLFEYLFFFCVHRTPTVYQSIRIDSNCWITFNCQSPLWNLWCSTTNDNLV